MTHNVFTMCCMMSGPTNYSDSGGGGGGGIHYQVACHNVLRDYIRHTAHVHVHILLFIFTQGWRLLCSSDNYSMLA